MWWKEVDVQIGSCVIIGILLLCHMILTRCRELFIVVRKILQSLITGLPKHLTPKSILDQLGMHGRMLYLPSVGYLKFRYILKSAPSAISHQVLMIKSYTLSN